MFLISCLKDNVKIAPSSFGKAQSQAITECLNEKYSNRVVYNLGLCVSVWDLVEIEDPIVYPGEGGSFVKVTFRMAIFKPFIGEVLVGKVKYCDEEGIKVSVGFFDDLYVPAGCLPVGCAFDAAERIWVWNYEGNSLYIDLEEYIRVRVMSEKFVDVPPVEKDLILSVNSASGLGDAKEYSKKTSPYIVTVSIGLLSNSVYSRPQLQKMDSGCFLGGVEWK